MRIILFAHMRLNIKAIHPRLSLRDLHFHYSHVSVGRFGLLSTSITDSGPQNSFLRSKQRIASPEAAHAEHSLNRAEKKNKSKRNRLLTSKIPSQTECQHHEAAFSMFSVIETK